VARSARISSSQYVIFIFKAGFEKGLYIVNGRENRAGNSQQGWMHEHIVDATIKEKLVVFSLNSVLIVGLLAK
jgi:hypothetical protein